MYPLFETIRIDNGALERLSYHNQRLNRSRKQLFSCDESIDLQPLISVPKEYRQGLVKCKVTYGKSVSEVTFTHYAPRKIRTLQLMDGGELDYTHKFVDRTALDKLKAYASADEIIILKNGFITDTSFSNLIFFDGKEWVTPSTPLLKGTMRQFLLEQNLIREKPIKVADLNRFSCLKLINAMLPFSQTADIPMNSVLSTQPFLGRAE